MSREVIVVGGLASKAANLAPFKLLGSLLSAPNDPHFVDGAHLCEGKLQATTPSEQIEEIDEIVAAKPESDFLIVSHSLGAIAAVRTVQEHPVNARGVLIAPPLPSPIDTHRHSRIQARINDIDGQSFIPSYSFALGDQGPSETPPFPVNIAIPSGYALGIERHSAGFFDDVRTLMNDGKVQLVIPSKDWNTACLLATSGMPGIIAVDGSHSLQAGPSELEETCNSIVDGIYSKAV